jgi:Bifunctional DNA primase/polymerase, N-terminal
MDCLTNQERKITDDRAHREEGTITMSEYTDFPPNIQAVLAVTEEGDSCVVCIELEALIQKRRSLGAAGRGMSPLDVALEYIDRGWSPLPIPHKSKAPLDKGWPAIVVTEENVHQYFNGAEQNIGVRLGGLSDGLADIDLDCVEAITAAPAFLPSTRTFGRASKRFSHWLFKTGLAATEEVATIKFQDTQKPAKVILEVRIGGGDKAA